MAIRVLPTHALAYDQVDYLQGDFFTRIVGLTNANLTLSAFYNNTVLAWTLASGVGVTDAQILPGRVYFHEITPGYYSLRFKPNVAGYWRFVFDYPTGTQSITLDYDILDPVTLGSTGLKASFVKPGPYCG